MSADATSFRISVPGNLLLFGEYAVLEEEGLGLAAAVEPRVRLQASASLQLRVEGTWPGGSGTSPFVSSAVRVVSEHLEAPCTGALRVDSSDLFSADGRKIGLGSSAAVSVALVCGLLGLAGQERIARGPRAAALAVRAHRMAQGGRGSGYDVLASFYGGCGLFRGGADPTWEARELPAGTRFLLFHGPAPVSTADAVGRYSGWKRANPGEARAFLADSNAAIQSFLGSSSREESIRWFARSRELGIRLGTWIGVPAEIPVPQGLDPAWCKALGAGSELGVCWLPRDAEPPRGECGFRVVQPAGAGVAWEY